MLHIVQAPNAVLATTAKPVGKIDKDLLSLIGKMEVTLLGARDPEGVGLAAPQVGKSLQLFIVKEGKNAPLLTFINPVLKIPDDAVLVPDEEEIKKEDGVKLEGCLSLKDIWGIVRRFDKVDLTYMDEKGEKHTKRFDGFLATIIQHEVDHLQGHLFPKRVLEQKGKLYKAKKDEKGEIVFSELSV